MSNKKDILDQVMIRGKTYSIKKIEKLYEKDTAKAPRMAEGLDLVWFCPECNEFHNIDPFSGIKDKYCSCCGQKSLFCSADVMSSEFKEVAVNNASA